MDARASGCKSALVAAAGPDVVRLDGGEQPQPKRSKHNLAEVREAAKRRFAEQNARENSARSRAAVLVNSADVSAPAVRRSPRTRS